MTLEAILTYVVLPAVTMAMGAAIKHFVGGSSPAAPANPAQPNQPAPPAAPGLPAFPTTFGHGELLQYFGLMILQGIKDGTIKLPGIPPAAPPADAPKP